MAKITKLTAAQIARFPEFVDQWTKIGLCTDPADRPRAEAAIRRMYERGGQAPPAKIVWCGSPLSQGMTRAIILDRKLMRDVGDSVWDSVRDSVGDSVRDSVWAGVRDSVWDSVRASVWDSVWAGVRDSVWDSVYGAHDAGWLSFYRYFHDAVALTTQTERLDGLWELAQSAGWALPHHNICWVSERHNILNRDEQGRLHNLVGPACAYPDGWAIYAVHGVRLPAWIIEQPAQITVEKIDAEANAEVRRVMTERYGLDRFLRDANATRLDHDDSFGTLWRRDMGDDEPIVAVEVINSTPEPDGSWKHYMLRVPPEITKAHDAVAWTFGVKAKEYAPAIET